MAQRGPRSRSATPRRKSTESAELVQPLKKRKKQAQVDLQEQCLTNPGDKLVIHYSITEEKVSSVPCFRKGHFPEAFLWPLTADEFLKKYYKQRVYTSHGAGIDRTRFLVEKHLSSLSLSSLLKRTPSPHIFVWMRNQSDGQIESFSIDDVKAALTLHNAGASLYFRAPQEMADQVVAELTDVLGLNFGGYFPNGDVKGEIETFVSKKGHVTDWHFDFQENFTVQLQGTKRWKLLRSGITHPIRGCPHYKTADNVEEQLKVHRMQDPHFKWRPASFDGAEEVVLRPGDCFYHPAGLWHRVWDDGPLYLECLSDERRFELGDIAAPSAAVCGHGVLWFVAKGVLYSVPESAFIEAASPSLPHSPARTISQLLQGSAEKLEACLTYVSSLLTPEPDPLLDAPQQQRSRALLSYLIAAGLLFGAPDVLPLPPSREENLLLSFSLGLAEQFHAVKILIADSDLVSVRLMCDVKSRHPAAALLPVPSSALWNEMRASLFARPPNLAPLLSLARRVLSTLSTDQRACLSSFHLRALLLTLVLAVKAEHQELSSDPQIAIDEDKKRALASLLPPALSAPLLYLDGTELQSALSSLARSFSRSVGIGFVAAAFHVAPAAEQQQPVTRLDILLEIVRPGATECICLALDVAASSSTASHASSVDKRLWELADRVNSYRIEGGYAAVYRFALLLHGQHLLLAPADPLRCSLDLPPR